jgi:two-component system, OmpR family, phosphate regulon sensor histidine kinase PhoR
MSGQSNFEPRYRALDPSHLQRASDFHAALLGMAGHDLRQPLQVIQSAYEWLSSRVTQGSEKARIERGERAIARITEQLDRLLGALRLYQHSKSMELSPMPLGPMLCRIVSEAQEVASQKDIELRVKPTRGVIVSNPVLLGSILRNLIVNGIKYTEPGGRILVGSRRAGGDIRIDVYDTGVGMAPEHLPLIFDAFHRLDSTNTDGLGVGLFVVRRAVELLGHRIEVSSHVGRGSRFSVFAPRVD